MEKISVAALSKNLEELAPESIVVAFYVDRVHGSGQHRWMDALAAYLHTRGYVTVAIATPQSEPLCSFSHTDYQIVLPPAELAGLHRINVFFTSDVESAIHFPQTAIVMATAHRLYYDFVDHSQLVPVMRWVDAYLVHGRIGEDAATSIRELWTGYIGTEHHLRKRCHFHIVPCGYPSLKYEIDQISAVQNTKNAIIYAPIHSSAFQESSGDRMQRYGITMVARLLECLPGQNVIFRPDPKDRQHPAVVAIENQFSSHPRFSLDISPNRADTFSRGLVLITDYSNIFKTFSYSTLRPAIYYMPWGSPVADGNYDCGYMCNSLDALIARVRYCLAHGEEERERLARLRRNIMVDPTDAYGQIETVMRALLRGCAEPGWLTLSRDPARQQDECDLARKCAVAFAEVRSVAARNACRYRNQSSPLLAALALHTGLMHSPCSSADHLVLHYASKILGRVLPRTSHKAVSPVAIKELYWRALREYTLKKRADACQFVRRQLRDYETLCPQNMFCVYGCVATGKESEANAIAVGIIPASQKQLVGLTFYLGNILNNKTYKLQICEFVSEANVLDLNALRTVYMRHYKSEELYIVSNEQYIYFDTSGIVLDPEKFYVACIKGEKPLMFGLSHTCFIEDDYFLRGWYSVNSLTFLHGISGCTSIARREHYR